MSTCLEIVPFEKETEDRPNNIIPLPPQKESIIKLPDKYLWTPHLGKLPNQERKEFNNDVCPYVGTYDSWARIPWNRYGNTVAPTQLYKESLSHSYYTDPATHSLPPIIYK